MDYIKLNSYIHATTAAEIKHGYIAASVKKLLTSIKYMANATALSEASGKQITLRDIANARHA